MNRVDRVVEVYTDPRPDQPKPFCATHVDYSEADAVPVVIDGQTVGSVAVRDILP